MTVNSSNLVRLRREDSIRFPFIIVSFVNDLSHIHGLLSVK
ncbi:Uncharacterised protein [Vibrio cholerae]|nr:Uncharacterised protein [Vibrio cholerae]CSC19012.1 Uncharacterised protein [Vibrio cholerae]CSC57727.1 Uncharacterised protein [Vibrio cholerae]